MVDLFCEKEILRYLVEHSLYRNNQLIDKNREYTYVLIGSYDQQFINLLVI